MTDADAEAFAPILAKDEVLAETEVLDECELLVAVAAEGGTSELHAASRAIDIRLTATRDTQNSSHPTGQTR